MMESSADPVLDSIPSKGVDLVEADTALPSSSPDLASLSGKCDVLNSDSSSLEKSIEEKFQYLERPSTSEDTSTSEKHSNVLPATENVKEEENEVVPRPELKSFCAKMDFRGLISYVIENRKEISTIRRELGPALRLAMNPVALVLDSLVGFFPPKEKADDLQVQMTCVNLLEGLYWLAPKIKRVVRKRAYLMAVEWKGYLSDAYKDSTLVALGFLYLVVIFGLVDWFGIDYLFDVLLLLIRRKQSDDLCQSFALEDMLPVFINKLGHKGKQIEAIRLVFEFSLMEKCSPSSLLDTYVSGAKNASKRLRKKNRSQLCQIDSITKEIDALKIVIKIAEDYKLCPAYNCEKVYNRIEQLEKQKQVVKRTTIAIGFKQSEKLKKVKECTVSATDIKQLEKQKEEKKRVATTSAATDLNAKGQMQNQHHPNKRLRPSSSTVAAPLSPYEHTKFTFVPQTPYMSSGGPYSLVEVPAIYGHVGVRYCGDPVGLDGAHYVQNPHLYSLEPPLDSDYNDNHGAVPYGSYPVSVTMEKTQNEDRAITKVWTKLEEDALIIALKDVCARGWIAENDTFKEGFLIALEKAIDKKLPGAMIKAKPHIESKLATWKRYYAWLAGMLSTPGFGWNEEKKCIVVDSDDIWELYPKRYRVAKNMRNKSFPYFDDWKEIFGKGRSIGGLTEPPADMAEEIEKLGGEDVGKLEVSFEYWKEIFGKGRSIEGLTEPPADMVEETEKLGGEDVGKLEVSLVQHKVGESQFNNRDVSTSSKEGDRSGDLLSEYTKVLSTFRKDTKESLSLMANRIGHEADISANRRKVVQKMSTLGLDIEKELRAIMLIASDFLKMDVFFSLDDTRLIKWIEMLLDGKI